jgi:hypothetical protein
VRPCGFNRGFLFNLIMNILKEADRIVNTRSEEKERQYGPMSYTNQQAAKIASVLCKREITTADVYFFQIALKLARESWSHKEDNLLDLVAYVAGYNNYMEGILNESNDVINENK